MPSTVPVTVERVFEDNDLFNGYYFITSILLYLVNIMRNDIFSLLVIISF